MNQPWCRCVSHPWTPLLPLPQSHHQVVLVLALSTGSCWIGFNGTWTSNSCQHKVICMACCYSLQINPTSPSFLQSPKKFNFKNLCLFLKWWSQSAGMVIIRELASLKSTGCAERGRYLWNFDARVWCFGLESQRTSRQSSFGLLGNFWSAAPTGPSTLVIISCWVLLGICRCQLTIFFNIGSMFVKPLLIPAA